MAASRVCFAIHSSACQYMFVLVNIPFCRHTHKPNNIIGPSSHGRKGAFQQRRFVTAVHRLAFCPFKGTCSHCDTVCALLTVIFAAWIVSNSSLKNVRGKSTELQLDNSSSAPQNINAHKLLSFMLTLVNATERERRTGNGGIFIDRKKVVVFSDCCYPPAFFCRHFILTVAVFSRRSTFSPYLKNKRR